MATIGSLVVDLKANTAGFEEGMGRARGTLGRADQAFSGTTRHAARFAAEGLGSVVDASGRFEYGMTRVIQSAAGATGALGALGRAGLAVGVGLGALTLGQRLFDEVRSLRDFGELQQARLDRLKEEAEAEKTFLAQRRTGTQSALALQKDMITAESELAAVRHKAAGDELGAAEVTVAGKLRLLEIERATRTRAIVETVKSEFGRSAQLLELDRLTSTKRLALEMAFVQQAQEIHRARFLAETALTLEGLKQQASAREAFDARVQAAAARQGFGGGALIGFARVRELQQDVAQIAAGFRDLVAQGTPIGDLFPDIAAAGAQLEARMQALREEFATSPTVLTQLDRALGAVDFKDFSKGLFAGTFALRGFEDSTGGVAQSVAALGERLARDLPAGVEAADPEIQKLTASMAGLKAWVDATNGSVIALIQNLAGAGQAPGAAGP